MQLLVFLIRICRYYTVKCYSSFMHVTANHKNIFLMVWYSTQVPLEQSKCLVYYYWVFPDDEINVLYDITLCNFRTNHYHPCNNFLQCYLFTQSSNDRSYAHFNAQIIVDLLWLFGQIHPDIVTLTITNSIILHITYVMHEIHL